MLLHRVRHFVLNFSRAFGFAWSRLLESRQKQIAWHRAELMRLDPGFYVQEQGFELIRRREEFVAKGCRPGDSDYPTFADLIEEAKR